MFVSVTTRAPIGRPLAVPLRPIPFVTVLLRRLETIFKAISLVNELPIFFLHSADLEQGDKIVL